MVNKKILMVDDEPAFLQLMSDYFKSYQYDVSIADNLEDAVKLFRREKPKVVLLDYQMPIVTGEQLLPMLQSMDPMIRVIVLTGFLKEEVEEKFKGLGYYAFFRKGDLSLEELKEKVEEAFLV